MSGIFRVSSTLQNRDGTPLPSSLHHSLPSPSPPLSSPLPLSPLHHYPLHLSPPPLSKPQAVLSSPLLPSSFPALSPTPPPPSTRPVSRDPGNGIIPRKYLVGVSRRRSTASVLRSVPDLPEVVRPALGDRVALLPQIRPVSGHQLPAEPALLANVGLFSLSSHLFMTQIFTARRGNHPRDASWEVLDHYTSSAHLLSRGRNKTHCMRGEIHV